MRDRLEKFIKSEELTPSRFAEIMGVQPSSISHILGGRNKPSFDFIEKILMRFPKLNPDWIILGKGPIYRQDLSQPKKTDSTEVGISHDLFAFDKNLPRNEANQLLDLPEREEVFTDKYAMPDNIISPKNQVHNIPTSKATSAVSLNSASSGAIEQIIVFHKDHTFTIFKPQ